MGWLAGVSKTSLVCVWLFLGTSAFGSSTGDGLNFLLRNQSPTGGFGETTGEVPAVATHEALATLRSMGMTSSSEAQLAELFLTGLPPFVDSELEFRRQLALAPTTWARFSGPLLPTHGPGFEEADPLHLSLALRALWVPGQLPTTGAGALSVQLAQRQRASGCYGYVENEDSAGLTAQVVIGLRNYTFNGSAQFASLAALQCLRSMQRTDGSWGSVGDTASVVLALLETQSDNSQAISLGRSWLLATQGPDGSWGGSARVTALAVRALAVTGPDWRVATDERGRPVLVLSNPEPVRGESVTASVAIENRAGSPAPQNLVRVYARAVGFALEQVVGQSILPALAAGQSTQVSILIPTAQLSGRYTLRAAVDPDDTVPELDDFNNEAMASINVRSENDLSVGVSSIHFTSTGAGVVRVDVDVRNLGLPLPAPVNVDVYKGNPAAGGVKLGTASIPAGLGVNQVSTISVNWNAGSANGPTPLFAVVDPERLIAESDESNNQAFRFYFPAAGAAVDLSVADADLSATPAAPRPGENFTFRAMVRNPGTTDVNRVGVSVFEQASPRRLLAHLELPFVAAGASTLAETSFALQAGGSGLVLVEVDTAREFNDTNRTNNLASIVIYLSQAGPPRELRAVELSTANAALQNGAPVQLSFRVQNVGTEAVRSSVRLVDQVDGRVWATTLLPLLARETRVLSMGPFTTPNRPAALKACVDPDDVVEEPNENDNCSELTVGLGSTDVSLHPRDLRFTPTGAAVGEEVQLAATVRNATTRAASAMVEWWLGNPLEAEGVLLGTTRIQVPAGGSTTAQFDWIRVEGSVEVFARLAQVSPADSALHNNLAGRHLFLEEIVDLGLSSFRLVRQPEVRIGRLTGSAKPELVVGYAAQFGPSLMESGVAMLQNSPDGGYQLRWRRPGLDILCDVALADLDADGTPEVIQVTTKYQAPYLVQIDAIRPDGTLKWQQTFLGEGQVSSNNGMHVTIGDVNGDGIADIVFQQATLRVLSGDDGHLLFATPVTGSTSFAENANALVLDVDGDGHSEILGTNAGVFLLDRTGAQLWRNDSINSNEFAVVDLDLDGSPEMVFPANGVAAIDLQTGVTKGRSTSNLRGWEYASPSSGALRQDGLPYAVLGDNSTSGLTMAYRPDLSLLWARPMSRPDYLDVFTGTLADLVGLGRPQLIANSNARAFVLQDGRDGRPLLGTPHAQSAILTSSTYFYDRQPVVADARGDGTARILVGTIGDSLDHWPSSGAPNYGQGVLVFGSPHWKKQPPTWPTRTLVKGRIGDDLRLVAGYRWWTGHNTWNQQFDVEPARLLPDLELRAGDVSTGAPLTAGEATTLSALVHNVGGISASAVRVSFYDGEPPSGRLLGVAVVPGPIAPRGGTAMANLSWLAYPEGEHLIFAVVNADGAIEESGTERNTASVRAFVGPGTRLCDVSLDAASLAAQPAAPLAGEVLTLTATLRNLGLVGCEATLLSVRDGSPLPGASTAVAPLAPGATTTVSLSLVATPGTHLLRFTVDEAGLLLDGDRGNNEATLPLFVPQSLQPDLFASSLTLSPSPAYRDGTVQGALLVRNLGSASPSTTFRVTLGGTAVAAGRCPPLRAGESASLAFSLRAPASTSDVVATLDDLGAVAEFNENNNLASALLVVAPSGLSLAGAATPALAGPNTAVTFQVTATHQYATARQLFFDAQVLNESGATVAVLATAAPRILGATSATSTSYAWNTGASPPGLYRLRVTARDSAGFVARADTTLTVSPGAPSLVASLLANRGTVPAGGDVVLSFVARNTSGNLALTQLIGTLSVFDASAQLVFREVRQLGVLAAGGVVNGASVVSLGRGALPGRYTAILEVADATTLLAQAGTGFDVQVDATAVVANISAQPAFQVGALLPVEVLLTNHGALALGNQSLRLELVNVEAGLVIESLGAAILNLGAGATQSHTFLLATTGVPTGQKLLVARLEGRVMDTRPITALPLTDIEPPRIDVLGITDGEFTNQDVRPVVLITDASAVTSVVMLDGAPFTAGDVVAAEGPHTLTVDAQDIYGNRSWVLVRFTVDKTPPVLTLTGPAHGSLHLTAQTLSWTATDATTEGKLDTLTIISGALVAMEGDFVWTVSAEDAAGNVTSQTRLFGIDASAPVIVLFAPAQGAYVNGPALLDWTVTDAHPRTVVALLDGNPITAPASATAEGLRTLTATATDALGNTASASRSFTIDDTPPVITISGVTSGALLRGPVSPVFSATDINLFTVSATLNGAPFTSGTQVSADGDFTLEVIATDRANNVSTRQVLFTLDAMPPQIQVAGVMDGQVSATSLTPSFTATDAHLAQVSATLDGAPWLSGAPVVTEGPRLLVVTASDAAGNSAQRIISFTLDFTAPVISITGVTNGATGASFMPIVSVTDATAVTTSITLDGAPFSSGTAVTSSGAHVLAVTARDAAGNLATRTVTFTVVAAGGQCIDLNFLAERRYSPSSWRDVRYRFSLAVRVSVPWTLDVTAGNAGNKKAYLFLGLGAQTTRCEYKGGSPVAHPTRPADVTAGRMYRFVRCTNGVTAGSMKTVDDVRLHVHDGDSKRGTTRTSWRFQEAQACVGAGAQDAGVPAGQHCGHDRVACGPNDGDDDDDDDDGHDDDDDQQNGSGR